MDSRRAPAAKCNVTNCTCGIYAASSEKHVPSNGNVRGKVKLWGKVVPGDDGYRAEFAYPSEFRVPAALADHPTLEAFGVPVVVGDPLPLTALRKPGMHWGLEVRHRT